MTISDHPFFTALSPTDSALLIAAAQYHQVPADSVIFEENTPCNGLYLVLEGTFAISKRNADGTHRFVNYAKEGSAFGEIGILLGQNRSARATSITPSTYAVIPQETLQPFISASSALKNLIRISIGHLSATTQHYLSDISTQENLAMLGTLINSVLHDFKNPLNLIALNTQVLAQLHPDERTQSICQNIEAQVERMTHMAAEIGEFSRSGKKTIFSKVNLRELIETFQFLNAPLFSDDLPSLKINVESVEFDGEPKKLLRVLQNIVGNAVEALQNQPDGQITIEGKASPDGGSVLIQISDNGPGIPAAVQKRFWEPFFTHGKDSGTGLGSAIAKAMIEAHGGKIHFISSPANGTTFFIALPVNQSTPHPEVERHLLDAFIAQQNR